MSAKLRGNGPKTFITYSFGNTLASHLTERLSTEGFQVTMVDDRSLVGTPSLSSALEDLIQDAEVVVPVLDAKANESEWVRFEITIAKRSNLVIVPVVQDAASLPDIVRDIPYVTERNLDALSASVLKDFALLRLDPKGPFHIESDCLRAYLASDHPYRRVILDSDDFTGELLDGVYDNVVLATEKQPGLRSAIELQVREALNTCIRYIDRAQQFLPRLRGAIASTLNRYGTNLIDRSIGPWQRTVRLIAGIELLEVAQVLLPQFHPAYWGEGAVAIGQALQERETCIYKGRPDAKMWALRYRGDEAPSGWLDVYLIPGDGLDFRGIIPKTEYVSLAVGCGERPETFLDPWHWADFGIPQLFRQALILADRFDDSAYLDSIIWNLADYTSSNIP